MELEPMDEFERELRQALERRPAPPGLKRRLMEKRRAQRPHRTVFTWQRLAASIALAACLAGGMEWRQTEQRREEEEARRQVLIALRITGHALNRMNAKLAAHTLAGQDRAGQD